MSTKVGLISQAVGRKKAELIETALLYWARNCHPNRKEFELLDEIAFEERFDELAQFTRPEVTGR